MNDHSIISGSTLSEQIIVLITATDKFTLFHITAYKSWKDIFRLNNISQLFWNVICDIDIMIQGGLEYVEAFTDTAIINNLEVSILKQEKNWK